RLGHELRIVSAMVEDVPDDGLPIVRVPPIPIHFRPDQRMNLSHNHLAGTNNYLSKTISLPRLVRAVRRVRSEFRPDVIHFVENYGPAMLALRPAFPRIPMPISAPTSDALVSFWTGFIQQTTEDDFHAAEKTANLVLDRDPSKFAFLFCFKPEHFKESFQASERPGLRVFGSAEAFHAARLAADVFLSP